MLSTFFIFLSLFLYSYFWYILVIFLLWKIFPKKHIVDESYEPYVTIMMPVKNEEFTIKEKLENCFKLDYPKDKVQLLVMDSSSDDKTQKIVESFKDRWVELQIVPHKWKAYAMEVWINKYAKWEIIISTDANAYFKENVVREVVKHFSDKNVWWVSGAMLQLDESGTIESKWGDLYWKIEKFLRTYESKFHSCISMNWEITCFRKDIPKDKQWYFKWDPDDFDLSLFIVKNWYRIIYENNAKVWEKAPDNASDVEKQKVRIIVQTISAFTHYFSVLFKARFWFILFSHKFVALLSPLFLVWLYISNLFLLNNNLFLILFILQNILYFFFIFKINFSIFKISNFFIFLNYLIFKSYFVYISWKDFTKWDKVMSSRN